MRRKLRIFYLAWTPPNHRSGATLAMHRHFIQHHDFDLFVATDGDFHDPDIPSLKLERPPWIRRLGNTRFCRWVRQYEMVVQPAWVPASISRAIASFKPDAIFTVADNTLSWTAAKAARQHGLPLIVNFQDWWPRGQYYYEHERPFLWVRAFLEKRFRKLHEQAALVFCTSEGMKEFLGPHPNSHVLYPIGAKRTACGSAVEMTREIISPIKSHRKRRLLYTGTAFGSYGRLLRALAGELAVSNTWQLEIYGTKPDWPTAELDAAIASGMYRGFLPFDKLQEELGKADAFLAVMSFDAELKIMMQTSFTTKMLDYCAAAKPVIVWGPEFCNPVRLVKRTQSALTVEVPEVWAVLSQLARLDAEPGLGLKLSKSAYQLSRTVLDHDNIHAVLVENISSLLGK
jgi:glycosyltransferase involved in cell wall biosynthesis